MLGFSIVMDNVDALWSTIKDKVGGLKYKEPFDQEYGMREIHAICIYPCKASKILNVIKSTVFVGKKFLAHLLFMKLLNSVFADVFVNNAVCPPGISTN